MRVAHSISEWKSAIQSSRGAVLSVGNFDGLHLGHQKILRAVADRARKDDLTAAVITFDPHPMKVLQPADAPALIMTLPQRLAGFERAGIAATLVLHFDQALADVSAEDFVQRVLLDAVRGRAVFVGANFRFGHKNAGDVPLLQKLGQKNSFEVVIVPPAEVNGSVISSTAIRRGVAEGRVEEAAAMLGAPFTLTGKITPGEGRGSKIVFPTLNLAPEQELLPARGVYATKTHLPDGWRPSVTNVGIRPTFDGKRLTIESHLLGFSGTHREGPLEVRFLKRLRDEQKFSGADELRAQIARDIASANDFFQLHGQPAGS
jgi:riboflavin kinase / FMN adenylyltransferase